MRPCRLRALTGLECLRLKARRRLTGIFGRFRGGCCASIRASRLRRVWRRACSSGSCVRGMRVFSLCFCARKRPLDGWRIRRRRYDSFPKVGNGGMEDFPRTSLGRLRWRVNFCDLCFRRIRGAKGRREVSGVPPGCGPTSRQLPGVGNAGLFSVVPPGQNLRTSAARQASGDGGFPEMGRSSEVTDSCDLHHIPLQFRALDSSVVEVGLDAP